MTKEELVKKKFYIIQLGCDKNRVDGEKMAYLLVNYGLKQVEEIKDAEIVIVNTCAFIQNAKIESIDYIMSAVNLKSEKCEKVIVCGCFAQRYFEDAKKGFPEVDAVVRLKNNDKIVDVVKGLYGVDTTKNDCAKIGKNKFIVMFFYIYLRPNWPRQAG